MSSPAINPAPPPAPGATASSGAANTGQAQAAQAQDPVAAFEAMLAALFGAKSPAAGETTTPGAKTTIAGKTATDDSKTKGKVAGDDKTAAADGSSSNPNLALLVPIVANLPAAASTATTGQDSAAQPALANTGSVVTATDKTSNPTAANALAQLAGAPGAIDPDAAGPKATPAAQPATALAALAAGSAASDTAATAKVDAALTPKTDAVPAAQPSATTVAVPPVLEAPPVVAAAPAVTAPPALAAEKSAEAAAPVAPKERVQAIKASTRVDSVKTTTAPGGIAALTAKATDALQPVAGGPTKGGLDDEPSAEQPLVEAKPGDTGAASARSDPATSATTTPATLIHAAAIAVRGAPQTVANLAAQIVKKLDGRTSQFDLQLDPAGLGKVDVRIAIGADGRMSAAMSFDTPQAAAELKARAGELHEAMAQAGFDLSGGMSFDVASDRGQGQGNPPQDQSSDAGAAFRGRAFQAALDTTADTPPPQYALRRTARAGVDIRI